MKFLSDILAKAGLTVDGVVTLNNTATGQTPATNDNSTKLATTAFIKNQSYLSANQTITVSGDATGSGTTSIILTLANSGVTAGVYGNASNIPTITVDAKGRITSISTNAVSIVTTLAGLSDVTLTSPSANQVLQYNGTQWVNGAAPVTYTLPIATSSILGGIKVGTGLSIDAATGILTVSGGAGGNLNFRTIQEFTATAGQTTFTISGGYAVGYVEVLINGVYISENQYTATNGTTIVLNDANTAGDIVTVFLYSLYNLGASVYARNVDTLTATAGQTSFTTSYIPGQIDVYYNGSKLTAAEYTATTGSSIVLGQAAVSGDIIEVVTYLAGAGINASRTLTINGVTFDLTANRTWTLTTANISEVTNLYYTDARARAAISVTGSGSYNSSTGVITVTGGVTSVNTLTGAVVLTTTNIAEGTNLYYTTARANADFDTRLATKSTSNLTEGSNLYYTDARVGTYLTTNSYATQTYVGTQIANLVASAPATLDTLNELALALGNDPSFATTVATSIGTKVPQTRTITINGTAYDLSADRSWTIASGVTSFNTRTGAITSANGDYTTAQVTESGNLYYTDTRVRAAISLTTTGTSGAATYDSATGIFNIPQYQGGVTSFNTRTGAITLSSSDVTTALTYTPVTNARTLTINGTTYDLTADRSWSIAAGVTSFNTRTGAISLTSLDVTDALTYTPVTNARTLTINGTSYDLSANRSWTIAPDVSVRNTYAFTATAAQTTFTVSGGYTVGLVDVFINGVKLAAADFTATNGTTVVLGTGTGVGNIVEIVKYVSAFTTAVETTRTLTINGTTYDLSANRTWSIDNASLGAQPQLNGTGLVRMAGTTVSYDNATYATQSYVTTAVANLVNSAPSTLDTLNELATALGNDANFATTVTTSIGTKQAQLNGTGFVKISGTTISYDNSTYLTSASLTGYVPYTGATASVDLGAFLLTASGVDAVGYTARGSGTLSGYLILKQGTTYLGNVVGYNSINANARKYVFISDVDGTNYKSAIFELSSLTNNTDRTYTLPDASGTLALTSNLSSYLPLAGGTLTGALTAQAGLIFNTSQVISSSGVIGFNSTQGLFIYTKTGSSYDFKAYNGVGSTFMQVPTGTQNVEFLGTSTFSSDILGKGAFNGYAGATHNLLIDWSGESQITTLTNTNLFFGTNALRRMTIIGSSGNIGINEISPSYRLDVNGTGRFTGALSGTSATFSSSVTATAADGTVGLKVIGGTGRFVIFPYYDATEGVLINSYNTAESGYKPMSFQASAFRFSQGAATFSSTITANGGNILSSGATYGIVQVKGSGASTWQMFANPSDEMRFGRSGVGDYLTIANTGAATFSSSVSAGTYLGVSRNGSDTIGSGPYLVLSQTSNSRQWIQQMSASLSLDFYHYNGSSWIQPLTLAASGDITMPVNVRVGGLLTVGGDTNSYQIKSSDYNFSGGWREMFRVSHVGLTTSGRFTLNGTGNSFVHSSQWAWSSTHNGGTGRGRIIQLTGGEYSDIQFALDITGAGDIIISANFSTSYTLNVFIEKVRGGAIDTSNQNADRTSAASGYFRVQTITSTPYGSQFYRLVAEILGGSGNRAVYSDANGVLTNSSSDVTLKKNVENITYGLNSIMALRPISFNWIPENLGEQKEIGFIAQEVQELIPEVIGINNDETLSLDYPKLTAVLVKAIQELKAEIDILKAR